MKKILVLSLIFFTFTTIYPQTASQNFTTHMIQAFSKGAISSYGTSTLVNKVENIAYLNPSALNHFDNFSVSLSYLFESKIEEAWIARMGHSRVAEEIPESFGIIYPYENFRVGFGFGHAYNGSIDTDPIEVTTIENPDGTGETFELIDEVTVQSYTLSTSYSVENIFQSEDELSIGFRLNRNVLHDNERLNKISVDERAYCYSFAIGANYYASLLNGNKLGVGLFYESKMEFSKYYTIDPDDLTIYNPDTTRQYYVIEAYPYELIGKVPSKLIVDVDLDIHEDIEILGSVSSIFWNKSASIYNDQINFSGSVVYKRFENFILSAGLFSSTRKLNNNFTRYFNVKESESAVYLTAGVDYKYSGFEFDLSLADSNMFSGDWRKQTIVKVGLGYSL